MRAFSVKRMTTAKKIESYLRASIMLETLPWVLLGSAFTSGLVAIDLYVMKISSANLPFVAAFSIVIGFLLVFRTNTAYERYWEGRKMWSTLMHQSKSLARIIWVQVQPRADTGVSAEAVEREKLEAMRLILLFGHSVAKVLRQEHRMVRYNPRYFMQDPRHQGFILSGPSAVKLEESGKRLQQHDIVQIQENDNGFVITSGASKVERAPSRHLGLEGAFIPDNPVEVLQKLSKFLYRHSRDDRYKTLDGPLANNLEMASLGSLSDAYHNCLRILRTPIPRAYLFHLQHILALHCITFPFGVIGQYSWMAIPITAVVLYVFIGVYKIGQEIENPFGYDENDLPLESFLFSIESELRRIVDDNN